MNVSLGFDFVAYAAIAEKTAIPAIAETTMSRPLRAGFAAVGAELGTGVE
jgi:hypothetical protein